MNSLILAVKRTYGVAKKRYMPGAARESNGGGDLLYTTQAQMLACWGEHFYARLNQEGQFDCHRVEHEFLLINGQGLNF